MRLCQCSMADWEGSKGYKHRKEHGKKVSLNGQLSDTFFYEKFISVTVPIISSFLMGVNCVQLPFFPAFSQEIIEDFLNFCIKQEDDVIPNRRGCLETFA